MEGKIFIYNWGLKACAGEPSPETRHCWGAAGCRGLRGPPAREEGGWDQAGLSLGLQAAWWVGCDMVAGRGTWGSPGNPELPPLTVQVTWDGGQSPVGKVLSRESVLVAGTSFMGSSGYCSPGTLFGMSVGDVPWASGPWRWGLQEAGRPPPPAHGRRAPPPSPPPSVLLAPATSSSRPRLPLAQAALKPRYLHGRRVASAISFHVPVFLCGNVPRPGRTRAELGGCFLSTCRTPGSEGSIVSKSQSQLSALGGSRSLRDTEKWYHALREPEGPQRKRSLGLLPGGGVAYEGSMSPSGLAVGRAGRCHSPGPGGALGLPNGEELCGWDPRREGVGVEGVTWPRPHGA